MILRDFLIGILIFFAFISAMFMLVGELDNHYSMYNVTDINQSFGAGQNVTAITGIAENAANSTNAEAIQPTSFWGLVTAPWTIAKTILLSGYYFIATMWVFATSFGIPGWFVSVISSIILITLVMVISSAAFRRKM